MKTWMYESAFVGLILFLSAFFTGNSFTEWLGAAAVFCAFNYAQIADRLAEKQKDKIKPDVPCYRKLGFYFISKEALWLCYFMLHHSYSALVGVAIFLLYPFWRKIWRSHHSHKEM